MSTSKFLSLLASSIVPFSAAFTLEIALAAKSPSQVAQLAIPVTVQINSESGGGSGVIIDRTTVGTESTYFVITAKQIVENSQLPYEISTYTGESYVVSSIQQYQEIENAPELALVTFQTSDYYPVAAMGNSSETELGAKIAIFGYPDLGIGMTGSARPFIYSPGKVENLEQETSQNYYWSYDALTQNGMEGGPVFDREGQLVAIHGKEKLAPLFNQYKQGIPIDALTEIAPEFLAINQRRASLDEAAVIFGYANSDRYAGASWFYCDLNGEVPRTMARNVLNNANQVLISWEADSNFNEEKTPSQNCQDVSSRFQRAYYENRLNYLGVEEVNGLAVICGLTQEEGSCNEGNKLIELQLGTDGVKWLEAFLQGESNMSNLLAPLQEQKEILW